MSRLTTMAQIAADKWIEAGQHLPDEAELNDANVTVKRLMDKGHSFAEAREIATLPDHIEATQIVPGEEVVHWVGDPRIYLLMSATIEQLPEFLADENQAYAALAKKRLEFLVENKRSISKSKADVDG